MARALAPGAGVLLLDEPSEGLLRAEGVTMLLAEQKAEAALRVADRIAFIEQGRVRGHATPEGLSRDPTPLVRYVGVRRV